ncbi:MAG: type II toxin-antitoxin system RatA family toxin [Rickettsiaceae bacterium]|nr:type II toxin-antitoxin system RatA family toxin [Rickettsiaceae bacterium]
MTSIRKSIIVKVPKNLIFKIISDVEKYPEFLPWCKLVLVKNISADKSQLTVELNVLFAAISGKYISLVTRDIEHENFVTSKLISGPLDNLDCAWKLKALNSMETEIEFNLDFQFNSFMLETLSKIIIPKATEKILTAFVSRAYKLNN